MDAPFYIFKRSDPLRDRSIFKRPNSDVPVSTPYSITTPQSTTGRLLHQEDGRGPLSPWSAPAASPAAVEPVSASHSLPMNSASAFNRSDIARRIKANFDSLVRASPLPRVVEQLLVPTASPSPAHRPHWRAEPPTFAEPTRAPLAGTSNVDAAPDILNEQHVIGRPVPTPGPPQPGHVTTTWLDASPAGTAILSSSSQPASVQKPQVLRPSPVPATAGLLHSVLSSSAADLQVAPGPAHTNSPQVWGRGSEAGPNTPSTSQAGAATSMQVHRDPRIAQRSGTAAAAASPSTPYSRLSAHANQAAMSSAHQTAPTVAEARLWQASSPVVPRDPRLKGSAQGGSMQQLTGPPSAAQATGFLDAHQPDPEPPDAEIQQAVWALKAAQVPDSEAPVSLHEALLETASGSQLQHHSADVDTVPQPVAGESPFSGADGIGAAVQEDALACPGWQVEAFLNDMGSDDELIRQAMTSGRGLPQRLEADTAQHPCEQQGGGQASSQESLENKEDRVAKAVHQVAELCSHLNAERSAEAVSAPAEGTSKSQCPCSKAISDIGHAEEGPVSSAHASRPPASRELPSAVPAQQGEQPLNSSAGGRLVQGVCESPQGAEQQGKQPAAACSPSAPPMGLAGSSLPPVHAVTPPTLPAHPAGSPQQRSSASGQHSTLTSHKQRPRRMQAVSPSQTSQEAASSPGRQPRRTAKLRPTPSRFKGEAAAGDSHMQAHARSHADLASTSLGPDAEERTITISGARAGFGDEAVRSGDGGAVPSAAQTSDAGEAPSADQPAGEESSADAGAAQQQPAGSLQTEGDRGPGNWSQEEKNEEASSPIATCKKRPAPTNEAPKAKAMRTSKEQDTSKPDAGVQVSRTGRVRTKPLAFWANQRLSRETGTIDQGFSDQLAQQCQSFTQQKAKGQPSSQGSPSGSRKQKPAAQKNTNGKADSKIEKKKRATTEQVCAAQKQSKKHKIKDEKDEKEEEEEEEEELAANNTPAALSPQEKNIVKWQGGYRAAPFTSCEQCRHRKKGHCGTEMAVKQCLYRQGGTPPSEQQPAEAAPASEVTTPKSEGRTLGIKAQLQALSQRKHAAKPARPQAAKSLAAKPSKGASKEAEQKCRTTAAGSKKPADTRKAAKGQKGATSKQEQAPGKAATNNGAAGAKTAARRKATAGGGGEGSEAGEAQQQQQQRPGLRRLRKAGGPPRDDQAELAAAWELQDFDDDDREGSAAHLLASRFLSGAGSSKRKAGGSSKDAKAKKGSKAVELATETACNESQNQDTSGTPGAVSFAETEAATPVRDAEAGYDTAQDADGWTQKQKDALQMAHATEDPTGEMFWRRVSEWVEGKDAKQCFAKFWAANPTPAPARNVGPRAYVAAAAANSPVRPPGRTTAAGRARDLPAAATRKWARQARWQMRASHSEGPDDSKGADAEKGRQALNPILVEAMQRAERTDKYIDAIIKKRGNPQHWQSASMANGAVRGGRAPEVRTRPVLVDSAVAAIASSAQAGPRVESDSEDEKDEYWSGEESDS